MPRCAPLYVLLLLLTLTMNFVFCEQARSLQNWKSMAEIPANLKKETKTAVLIIAPPCWGGVRLCS